MSVGLTRLRNVGSVVVGAEESNGMWQAGHHGDCTLTEETAGTASKPKCSQESFASGGGSEYLTIRPPLTKVQCAWEHLMCLMVFFGCIS